MTGSKDKFANKMYGTVTETAANTLTFAEIHTNVNIFDKVAWILHRLEWYLSIASRQLMIAEDDGFHMALTSSQNISALGLDNPAVIDLQTQFLDVLSGVGFERNVLPVTRDFTGLPGGGLIITPRPLFLALQGISLAAVGTVECRGYFTQMTMSADEYLELVDFYRIVT